MIIGSEADIARVSDIRDRRELRNFQRFLKLLPFHGFDMLDRPRWRKYLGITPTETVAFQARGYIFKPGAEQK